MTQKATNSVPGEVQISDLENPAKITPFVASLRCPAAYRAPNSNDLLSPKTGSVGLEFVLFPDALYHSRTDLLRGGYHVDAPLLGIPELCPRQPCNTGTVKSSE